MDWVVKSKYNTHHTIPNKEWFSSFARINLTKCFYMMTDGSCINIYAGHKERLGRNGLSIGDSFLEMHEKSTYFCFCRMSIGSKIGVWFHPFPHYHNFGMFFVTWTSVSPYVGIKIQRVPWGLETTTLVYRNYCYYFLFLPVGQKWHDKVSIEPPLYWKENRIIKCC